MATINIRIDDDTKKKAEELFDEFGLNTTTAINIFLKAVIRERKIPFEISTADPFYSDENMVRLAQSIEQLSQGQSSTHELIEVGVDEENLV